MDGRAHNTGEVTTIPVTEIIEKYDPAAYQTDENNSRSDAWAEWFREAENDIIVQRLRVELQHSSTGFFDEPITLVYSPEEVDESDGEIYSEYYGVANGMHRVAAHVLNGSENALVRRGWSTTRPEEDWFYEASGSYVDVLDDVEKQDEFFNEFSWRVGGDIHQPWLSLETASFGSKGSSGGGCWSVFLTPGENDSPTLLRRSFPQVVEDLRQTAARWGIKLNEVKLVKEERREESEDGWLNFTVEETVLF